MTPVSRAAHISGDERVRTGFEKTGDECKEGDSGGGRGRSCDWTVLVECGRDAYHRSKDQYGYEGRKHQCKDEEEDCQESDDEQPSCHSFPVAYYQEAQIYQCRAGLLLEQYGKHRKGEYHSDARRVTRIAELELIFAHKRRQQYRCGDLGEFGRLQTERAQGEP